MTDGNGGSAGKRPDSAQSRRVASILVIVIAAVASVAFGVVSVVHAREFLAHHRTTGGVVTAASLDPASGCNLGYCSVSYDLTVSYQPPGRDPLTFTDNDVPALTPVGTHVLVYYLEHDPGDVRLDSGTGEQFGGIFFIAAGLVGFAIGYRKYRVSGRGRRCP